jgi:beta-galactosidase
MTRRAYFLNQRSFLLLVTLFIFISSCNLTASDPDEHFSHDDSMTSYEGRSRILLDKDWRFYKYAPNEDTDDLIYDVRPEVTNTKDDGPADAKPTEATVVKSSRKVLKPWIMPTGNEFIKDPEKRYLRPQEDVNAAIDFVNKDFDDSSWDHVNLPHDWAIEGSFYEGENTPVGGGMGRLPSPGVGWYRKQLDIPVSMAGKRIYLDVDGAMSYAMVWLNGHLVGGWPYGYNSWRVDLSSQIVPGGTNELAIRLDNPPNSSRWYTGAGLYRNVWLTVVEPIHVSHWGTSVTTEIVSKENATVTLAVSVDNDSDADANVDVKTEIFEMDANGGQGRQVAETSPESIRVAAGGRHIFTDPVQIENPLLWGPPPTQVPHRYLAVSTVSKGGKVVDQYKTPFGIRTIRFNPKKGLFVNGEHIFIKGVNQHHDLGALGAAFNVRAAERQLEILREMGCNAIRFSHNPPAPELLELTDKMGFLTIDEVFDVWERKKTPLDTHLIFPDWYEQDLRSMIRRDRNHPSIIAWSFGNEVGEQYTGDDGAALAGKLRNIVHEEDATRLATASMNYAQPEMPFPKSVDLISLNYQGEGIRDAAAYDGLRGIHTKPVYPDFHIAFPDKAIISSENASALSSRGVYLFPVTNDISAPVRDGLGGDSVTQQVSAYELHTADFGSSADKVFASEDANPYVAGGFVWSGWDYLGEPTPYYGARSSYSGIIDLAGFKKDRFYLYQSRWRPDLPMVHILPHWNWSGREGQVTPIHVFTSGDEVELFLNGRSLGRKKKSAGLYRLRWDDVRYEQGVVEAVAYKNGKEWAREVVRTTGDSFKLEAGVDRSSITNDERDLAFVTVRVADSNGLTVPTADNVISFHIEGPGEIVATDNGDPTDFTPFSSAERNAFSGLCLAIVRMQSGAKDDIIITAESEGLESATVTVKPILNN